MAESGEMDSDVKWFYGLAALSGILACLLAETNWQVAMAFGFLMHHLYHD